MQPDHARFTQNPQTINKVDNRAIDLRVRPLADKVAFQPFYEQFEDFFTEAEQRLDASQKAINDLDAILDSCVYQRHPP